MNRDKSRKKAKSKGGHPSPLPTRDEILKFIQESSTQVGKREIARAFGITGADKIALKAILKDLKGSGAVVSGEGKRVGAHGAMQAVDAIEVTHTDREGDMFGKPLKWDSNAPPPTILVRQPSKILKGRERRFTVGVGDRVLAKIVPAGDNSFEARPIKKLATAPARLLGVYEPGPEGKGGYLRPVDKKYRYEVWISQRDVNDAVAGDLVAAEVYEEPKHGPQRARVLERLGPMDASRNLSLIAIHTHGLPHFFSEAAAQQAQRSKAAPMGQRDDLRQIPLVTIDGEDARDFDDAVWAEPDSDPQNAGGWHLLVAIADVSWYVRPGDALDRDAYARGNSVYFPDRVVPMLPEELSNGWCSLKPKEDRPCLAAHMWIDADGKLLRHRIIRGMMRSIARLTYTQVQRAKDGQPDDTTGPLMAEIIPALYGAYEALDRARAKRGTLELNIIERKIIVDRESGKILGVTPRERYDSHKLIEEFMIAANVAAAETLSRSAYPAVYRVHDRPDPERIENLQEAMESVGLKFPSPGSARPQEFNRLLRQVKDSPHESMVNTLVLRTQAQAVYSPENIGHYGLGLRKYVHFTSPIRRYSDLLVHRALIAANKLGEGGWDPHRDQDLVTTTEHISSTERRAAMAERQTVDRFAALYLRDRAGAVFVGRISGVSRFGAFVTLEETGADGILPMRHLPQDFYDHDERGHRLVGRRRRLELRVGDVIDVRLVETDEVAGSIVFEYADRAGSADRGKHGHEKQRERRPKSGRQKVRPRRR
ncbi:MAG: ribonuclease R [Rhodospirillaceae bacterium]|nr:ribonuclease R [Rhodospirillaceae bacterium]